jgi:hypothetical protein
MKMLFFSADETETLRVRECFAEAGINCEIRHSPRPRRVAHSADAELWIKDDRDCHKAFLLCVQRGIGFARRRHQPDIFDLCTEQESCESETTRQA